ncbi:hypothetical protein GCM10010377_61530 [Streptomyces viridiviolaceus]|nr:hypothetical protein GCM10010377_61530 [Streptomyces viridiviolaceus]
MSKDRRTDWCCRRTGTVRCRNACRHRAEACKSPGAGRTDRRPLTAARPLLAIGSSAAITAYGTTRPQLRAASAERGGDADSPVRDAFASPRVGPGSWTSTHPYTHDAMEPWIGPARLALVWPRARGRTRGHASKLSK